MFDIISKRRWLGKVKDDVKENRLSADEVYDRATWRRTSTPHERGNKIRRRRRAVQDRKTKSEF